MKIAYLFAGQGAQKVGMGEPLYQEREEAKAVYEMAEQHVPVKTLCFTGTQSELDLTKNAQPCICATSLAIVKTLDAHGIKAAGVAGLSLGEYSALAYAKVIDEQDLIPIVAKRGELMDAALPERVGGMAAILGMDAKQIETVVQTYRGEGIVEVANYNAPHQSVISGHLEAISDITPTLLERGAKRVIPLAVSSAFHSSLLADAAQKFKLFLQQYTLQTPQIPVYHNVSATPNCSDYYSMLEQQMQSSVLFKQSIEAMIEDGFTHFIEIGPGSTLKGFVKKINSEVYVESVNDLQSIQKVVGQLGEA